MILNFYNCINETCTVKSLNYTCFINSYLENQDTKGILEFKVLPCRIFYYVHLQKDNSLIIALNY